MKTWFISDTHFGHTNILRYCSETRGHFSSIDEHDNKLIQNWNSVVQPNDEIYHLGDFGFAREGRLIEILNQLKGRKFFIRGNHDKSVTARVSSLFTWSKSYAKLQIQRNNKRQEIILFHYPIAQWDKSHHGSWHLHGHCHGTFPIDNNLNRLDVGVDPMNLFPVEYDQLESLMPTQLSKTQHEYIR